MSHASAAINRELAADVLPTIVDDGAVFNLDVLQSMLGQTTESTKKWVARHDIPCIKGRTWIFTGRTFREAVERAIKGGSLE